MVAEDAIDQIRARANLAEIIGESIKLIRKGRTLVGLCPFHKEKSPSFNVNEERGFYHCFGCKASGDVFKFVQETEGVSFLEAVRLLAERTGVELQDDLSSEQRRQRAADKRREESLYEVSRSAAVFFQEMLETHEHRSLALQELHDRGLPYDGPAREILRAFYLGYAPDSWDALANHLKKAGHDLRAAETVGLIAARKQGPGYYDRFRHRLMFAVLDLQGRILAFSGRALPPRDPGDQEPPAKYINSPESPIYSKRSTVFGLYQARTALRAGKPCILVEGNFDVVGLHAAGFTHAVAPLGTAFTAEQGRLIRRFTSNVTLLFDGDSAGKKATLASREAAKGSGLSARVARLPDGSDPDDFIRRRGGEALGRLLDAASGMLDYQIEEILDQRFAAADTQERADRIKNIIELFKAEDDPNVRALAEQHADRLAGRLGVDNARTFRALRASIDRSLAAPSVTGAPAAERSRTPKPQRLVQQMVLGCLLDFPQLLDSDHFLENAVHLEGELAAAVACLRASLAATHSREHHSMGITPNQHQGLHQALSRLPEELRPFARHRLAAPAHEEIQTARVELFANLDKLRRMELTKMSSSTQGELERARQVGDFEQELELLRQQEQRARGKRGL